MRRASHLLPITAIVLMFGVTMFASASATTITFSGLTGANGTPVATYTEGGFTVTSTLGQFFQGQLFGNPIPSLFAGPLLGSPMNDVLDVTRNGGGAFTLASVDLAANNGNVNFTFTGLLGGIQQYIVNGFEPGRPPGPFGFDTIINPDATIAIDHLRIALDIFGTSGNVDNIVVIAVPEPASILLLSSALVGIGVWRRRRIALLAGAQAHRPDAQRHIMHGFSQFEWNPCLGRILRTVSSPLLSKHVNTSCGHFGAKWGAWRQLLLIAAVGMSTWQACGLRVAMALPPVQGVVSVPIVAAYDVDPANSTFVFQGSINRSSADGFIAIDVLKDPKLDPSEELNWQYGVGSAQISGSGPQFTFTSPPLQIFNLTRWVPGGLGRARVAFVSKSDPSQRVLLPVQDEDGITPENPYVIVLADINPDRTNQEASGNRCVPHELNPDPPNDPTNPCTPNYLSANQNVLFFPPDTPDQKIQQRQATMEYYQQVGTAADGKGASIAAALGTLQKFRQRYFAPFQCNNLLNEPEAVTTYYNKGDLGIGREMHCINNNCPDSSGRSRGELACYVMNFGKRDGTARFGDKAEAQVAVQLRKPFATVAMVERQNILGRPNSVFFVVYDANGNLATSAQLDRKGYNTSIPGNCLQCHGINSRYTAHAAHEVSRAIFLPFDLDSFEFFSDDPNSALSLSRAAQEGAFRAQNRMVHSFSRLFLLEDARKLIEGWYDNDLFNGTFNGDFVPSEWSSTEQQKQLYREVNARTCRTCHISYEPAPDGEGFNRPGLQFGTYQEFVDLWPLIKLSACGPINVVRAMPNAEQTLRQFWTTAARAQLFAQVPNAFGDCAPPESPP